MAWPDWLHRERPKIWPGTVGAWHWHRLRITRGKDVPEILVPLLLLKDPEDLVAEQSETESEARRGWEPQRWCLGQASRYVTAGSDGRGERLEPAERAAAKGTGFRRGRCCSAGGQLPGGPHHMQQPRRQQAGGSARGDAGRRPSSVAPLQACAGSGAPCSPWGGGGSSAANRHRAAELYNTLTLTIWL